MYSVSVDENFRVASVYSDLHNTDPDVIKTAISDECFLMVSSHSGPIGDFILNGSSLELSDEYYNNLALKESKRIRDEGQYLPIEVLGSVFDAHKDAQRNIKEAIDDFDVLSTDGVMLWTIADNTDVEVTIDDLKAVKSAILLRYARYHADYKAMRNSLVVL